VTEEKWINVDLRLVQRDKWSEPSVMLSDDVQSELISDGENRAIYLPGFRPTPNLPVADNSGIH
jgi:hypothetical protein